MVSSNAGCLNSKGNTLDEVISKVNHQLQFLFLEIKKGWTEEEGTCFWALVNTKADEYAKNAAPYEPKERDILKKIVGLFFL